MKIQTYTRTTKVCTVDDLDERIRLTVASYSDTHLLGDVSSQAQICCETHSTPTEQKKSGLFRRNTGPTPRRSLTGVIVTKRVIVLGTVTEDGYAVCLGSPLVGMHVERPSAAYGNETSVFLHSRWIGSTEASSYLLPLGPEESSQNFLRTLQDLIIRAHQ
ncbi:hypothetical protein ABZV60_29550 [Streptomyces sp. NPDC004787]|uniref:hypothetical protein n=1 Tax=Streptomyces sp. NPDC004787 TaxID=3154291 RepID=UPI0033A6E69E